MSTDKPKLINLPSPILRGGPSLAEVIAQRHSVRDFSAEPILLFQLSQILWSTQGITHGKNNLRAVPSAGGTFPLEVYAVIGDNSVEQVDPGVYHYDVERHALALHLAEDVRWKLASAALSQNAIAEAPVSLVICAIYDKTLGRYSARGERYVYMEVGHSGQNVYLVAVAMNLGTLAIGAFQDTEVRELLQLENNVKPLYIMPVGKPA
jgi:SagB-type dehydrogenase family enzyme